MVYDCSFASSTCTVLSSMLAQAVQEQEEQIRRGCADPYLQQLKRPAKVRKTCRCKLNPTGDTKDSVFWLKKRARLVQFQHGDLGNKMHLVAAYSEVVQLAERLAVEVIGIIPFDSEDFKDNQDVGGSSPPLGAILFQPMGQTMGGSQDKRRVSY